MPPANYIGVAEAGQQYVMQLAQVKPESLQQAGVRLVVIGCGEWQPIQNYRGASTLLSFSTHFFVCPTFLHSGGLCT